MSGTALAEDEDDDDELSTGESAALGLAFAMSPQTVLLVGSYSLLRTSLSVA
ncbi:hypothetical protein [Natronorubrum bangense]|uniref:hypothetical protein n=1 Tax=Natronorubrum bangense TaxID=61858 RepID=UPI000AABACBE|nr:hypothetical protein [Natronorubrum bangense]